MSKSIEFAVQSLQLDLNKTRAPRSFYNAINSYLEACLHQIDDFGQFRYFETLIEISSNEDYTEIIITRHDDGDRYTWKLTANDSSIPAYYTDYVDGFFNANDIDEYVENTLWTLYQTLSDNGVIRYKKDLLNSH